MGSTYSEGRKGISADFETAFVDPLEEFPKHAFGCLLLRHVDLVQTNCLFARLRLVVQYHGCNRIVLERLPQNRTARHRTLLVVVASAQLDDDLGTL